MKSLVKVTLNDNSCKLVNEEQICYIGRETDNHAILYMSNGDRLEVVDPSFDQWENDLFIRRG